MDCPDDACGGSFKVTHTFQTGEGGSTQRRECTQCLMTGLSVVWLIGVEPKSGSGAAALARRLKAGEAVLEVSVSGSQPRLPLE